MSHRARSFFLPFFLAMFGCLIFHDHGSARENTRGTGHHRGYRGSYIGGYYYSNPWPRYYGYGGRAEYFGTPYYNAYPNYDSYHSYYTDYTYPSYPFTGYYYRNDARAYYSD